MNWFQEGGVMMYPLLVCALLVAGTAVRSASRLWRSGGPPQPRTVAGVDAVLFWGVFASILGVLGTLLGVMLAAQSIERAGEVEPLLVWGGVRVSLVTTVVGLMILAAAALLWFGLRARCRALEAAA